MKFLCIPCDSPMKLQSVGPPDRGSLAVVYACPACGYEMAMLTNAYETQVVQSLGVRIGPDRASTTAGLDRAGADLAPTGALGAGVVGGDPAGAGGSSGSPADALGVAEGTNAAGGKCPFSAMIPGADGARMTQPASVRWTAAAEARLANIPAFVRPMARTGIEKFAQENGASEVDETILDAAREFFGM